MSRFEIVPVQADDAAWVEAFIAERWGAREVVAHGIVYRPGYLPGFIARVERRRVGLVTYHIQGNQCEIVTLDSTRRRAGIGTALVDAVKRAAIQADCRRLWLITTNDNLDALRFYQKRGFVLVAVHREAADQARKLKPEIPLIGANDIPIRDEIELEMSL